MYREEKRSARISCRVLTSTLSHGSARNTCVCAGMGCTLLTFSHTRERAHTRIRSLKEKANVSTAACECFVVTPRACCVCVCHESRRYVNAYLFNKYSLTESVYRKKESSRVPGSPKHDIICLFVVDDVSHSHTHTSILSLSRVRGEEDSGSLVHLCMCVSSETLASFYRMYHHHLISEGITR